MALDPVKPRWASDPTSPLVTPPSGIQDMGLPPLTQIPAQYFNWLHRWTYVWILWLTGFIFQMLNWAEYADLPTWVVGGNDFSLFLGRIDLIRFNNSVFAIPATTLHLADVEGAPSALLPNTWYYVYVTTNVGETAAVFQISPTIPDGVWKTGAYGTHRYLNVAFVTDSQTGVPGFAFPIGSPIPFVKNGKRVRYYINADSRPSLSFTVGTGLTFPVVNTALSLIDQVSPLHARGVSLALEIESAAAAAYKVWVNNVLVAWHGIGDKSATSIETTMPSPSAVLYRSDDAAVLVTFVVTGYEDTNGEG